LGSGVAIEAASRGLNVAWLTLTILALVLQAAQQNLDLVESVIFKK
jgi:hypothetical protein